MPGIHAPAMTAPSKAPSGGPSDHAKVFAPWQRNAEAEAAAKAEMDLALQNAKADEAALWTLAEMSITPDLREYGERHKIPNFALFLHQSAFVAGWRAAMKAKELPDV